MKLHSDSSESGHACESRDMKPGCPEGPALLCNGSSERPHCDNSEADPDRAPGTPEDDSRSALDDGDDLTPEIQQASRIFQSFLSEKHKSITAPFWRPIGPGSRSPGPEMSFRTMHDKFANREYESITAFVADFRLMLENCYRFHGVDHWISKQAQKLEMILEQKLTLLSRTLREKTTLAVTSRGRFGTEDEKAPAGTSSRRRLVPRNLAAITVGSESIMVQALRLEELQRAKDEKRQRELERKGAEEASVKELEDWERSLLALADPWPVRTQWELPAIGHFLCLAQRALHLPEVVFYELELCLLMPRCSSFLSRVMTSLLAPPLQRSSALRRPPMPYRKWEAALRLRVRGWYRAVGRAEDRAGRAEALGLSPQFFWTLGEVSPLERSAFHRLAFPQRLWLLKGLCDHVYETQPDVQDAVLAQPIHECRESVLGYDGQDHAFIHFPHFCGADLRIYRQSPSGPMEFPLPLIHVQRSEDEPEGSEVKLETHVMKGEDSLWSLKEDGLEDGDLGLRGSCGPDSLRGLAEDGLREDGSGGELGFRRGERASPDLDSHRTPKADHMTSPAPQEPPRLWAEAARPGRDQKKKKRAKRTSRPSLKKSTARLSLQRARKRKDQRKRLGNHFDGKMLVRRPAGSALIPAGPSFQLICSSLDDLRVLISKTEDQLNELNAGKKRSERRPNKRAAVKELHITLIRLLNELLPWEPKLVKAFQRNRARLKKEFDDFRKHPEYENFVREPLDGEGSTSTDTLEDGEVRTDRTVKDDSEQTENVNLGNHESRVDRAEMHWSESGPFTRSSKRRQSGPVGEEPSLSKRGKPDPESSEPSVDPAKGKPPPASSFQGSCKPIQALLAKSVGNKVTLISHPTAAVMARVQERIKTSVTLPPVRLATTESATGSPDQVVYTTSGGVGLLRRGSTSVKTTSDHKSTQHVVILPSNLLIQSAESKSATSLPKTKTYLSNASGFTIPENKVPVQQVAPLKDPSTAVVAPNLRSVAVPKRTSEPKASANSTPAKPDAKQELRTVCIRDSQSILVTTRGGNTGVVKVQTSESGTGASPASPVFTISPQLQAFLVSKSSASRSKDVVPASSSTFLSPSALSKDAKTSIPGKSDSDGVLVTAKDIQGLKCGQKRTPPGSRTPDQSAFQKVFLVSPSPASNASPTTSACTLPGSRVMFISNSALTIPKEASEVNASSTSTPALKVIPKLGTTLSCASSGTSIGVPGLMSRILNPSATEASVKATPVIVSRVPAMSTSSGPHVGPKTCSVASRSPTGNAEGSLKAPSPVDGKTLTFSTLGTGHMASSALLSVVKPDVPLSISTLSTLHCKPGLTSGSSTTSYSGCLINKHTTPPVDVTANKTPMIASSHSLIKTASSAVSGPLPLTPPMAAKSVQEKIVINTTAPLAPGTQLLINNTRFVVPSQGLGPGSHVLLINSCPGGLASPGPRGPNSSTPPSVIQGVRLVTPVRLPSPKAGPPDRVPPLSTRAPLNVSLRPDVVRLPVFQTVSQGMVVSPKETSPPQGGLLSTTSPMLLQGRPSQNQVAQTMPPMKTAIARHSPMVSVPPMSSTISRMQKLPVAMVPPIGGHSSATPIASVPPSMNSVIMTPCPPIRAVQPWTIGKPAILPLPLHGQNTSPSKLLLSPDGAILNIVQPSSIQVLAKPMDARVIGSSSSSVPAHRLNTNDPLRKADPTGRPDL